MKFCAKNSKRVKLAMVQKNTSRGFWKWQQNVFKLSNLKSLRIYDKVARGNAIKRQNKNEGTGSHESVGIAKHFASESYQEKISDNKREMAAPARPPAIIFSDKEGRITVGAPKKPTQLVRHKLSSPSETPALAKVFGNTVNPC